LSGYINFKKRNPYAHNDPDYEAEKTPTTILDWENNKMNITFEKGKATQFRNLIKCNERKRQAHAIREANKPPPVAVKVAPPRPPRVTRQRMVTPPSSRSSSDRTTSNDSKIVGVDVENLDTSFKEKSVTRNSYASPL